MRARISIFIQLQRSDTYFYSAAALVHYVAPALRHLFSFSRSAQTSILIQLQRSNTYSYSAAWCLDPYPYSAAALGHLSLFSRSVLDIYSYSAAARWTSILIQPHLAGHLFLFSHRARTLSLSSLGGWHLFVFSRSALTPFLIHSQCLDTSSYLAAALGPLIKWQTSIV